MEKILVDTNIFIYSIDEDSKYFNRSRDFLFKNDIGLYTTSKNLSEFLTVITRHPQSSISIQQAIKTIFDFTNFITVLYASQSSYKIFINLLKHYKPTGLKIHDFEIVSIGLANNISTLATINIKDFEDISEVKLYTI